jgi:SNF2 family DNA or RNA helicase
MTLRAYGAEAQIERRRQRARSERFDVENLHPPEIHTLYRVFSHKSRRTYSVEIRDLKERVNRCSCPDYETNGLGTCKHIERVLLEVGTEARAGKRRKRIEIRAKGKSLEVRMPKGQSWRKMLAPFLTPKGRLRKNADVETLERAAEREGAILVVTPEAQLLMDDRERERRQALQKKELERLLESGEADVDLLRLPLYPFQHLGALFLATSRRALLADDMGLGKTVQALAACEFLREHQSRVGRVLIVCPASLKIQWAREIQRFTGEEAAVIGGPKAKRRKQYRSEAPYTVMNYELLLRDEEDVRGLDADVVILDEAQRIKNWRAKTTQVAKELTSPYAFVLTGTPLENKLEELYSIVQFLDRKLLGPAWKFLEEHTVRDEWGAIVGYKNLRRVRRRVSPILLRRKREEVLDQLPPRVENEYFVPLSPKQRALYAPMAAELRGIVMEAKAEERELEPEESARVLNLIVWMREVCDDAGLLGRPRASSKAKELKTLVEEIVIDKEEKVVIFSEFEKMTALLEEYIRDMGLDTLRLHGGLGTRERQRIVDRFTEDPESRIFLSTEAGGLGLNLQAARFVVNFELPWNPARLDQRVARLHRMGQEDVVNVVNLLTEGTIEERVRDVLREKKELFEEVIDGEMDAVSVAKMEKMELLERLVGDVA